MLSALNQKQMVFEALKNGAKHYIIKPIDPDNLIVVVDEVLRDEPKKVEKKPETKKVSSKIKESTSKTSDKKKKAKVVVE